MTLSTSAPALRPAHPTHDGGDAAPLPLPPAVVTRDARRRPRPSHGPVGEMGRIDSWATLAALSSSASSSTSSSSAAAASSPHSPTTTPTSPRGAAAVVAAAAASPPPHVLPVIQPAVVVPPPSAGDGSGGLGGPAASPSLSSTAPCRWTPESAVRAALSRLSDCPPWGGVALT